MTITRSTRSLFVILVFLLTALSPLEVRAAAGGPDSFGYTYVDSIEPTGPAFDFEDISQQGVPVTLNDFYSTDAISLGFPFKYYGIDYSAVFICVNGYISFIRPPLWPQCPYPAAKVLPNAQAPFGVIAGWWGDLNQAAGGKIQYQRSGTALAQRFIVQYTNVPHYNHLNPMAAIDPVTMQIKLFQGSNTIEVQYLAAPASSLGRSYTMPHSAGIENEDGTIGLQYYFGAGSLAAPLAVRYYYPDSMPPDTILGSTPAHLSNESSAAFTFNGIDIDGWVASYKCELDGTGFSTCSSPVSYSGLADGQHTFQVYAIDRAGNEDPSPAAFSWSIDTHVPLKDIQLVSPPDNHYSMDAFLTLQWLPAQGETAYQVHYNQATVDVGPVTEYIIGPLAPGQYSWVITAHASSQYTASSAARTFNIGWGMYIPLVSNQAAP